MSLPIAGTTRLKKLSEARAMIDEAWVLLGPTQGNIDEGFNDRLVKESPHTDLTGVLMKVDEKIVEVVVDLVNQGVIK